ncbi:hypothetical protein LP419_09465 [Massilia sp. H-1]|nr:hypothetical protein LP419_09465 [Massilia sp. H-1]
MNKHLFHLAFFTGAIAVIWVGFGFIDSSGLAMAMTALIFAVYLADKRSSCTASAKQPPASRRRCMRSRKMRRT